VADFDWIDLAAVAWFIFVTIGYQLITRTGGLHLLSISGAVQRHRIAWMRAMIIRDNRSGDAILLGTLSQGNAFFASTCAIAIGGLTAIVGSGEKAAAVLSHLPYVSKATPLLWDIKVMLLIGIFVYAFFKFAWAFRLTHYTAIMIGAMPNPGIGDPSLIDHHALCAAGLSGLAADHSNGGLRSFYYAAASLTWFFNPLAFIAATTFVGLILIRRDFFSRSRRMIAGSLT
jgi:uncharacterized membrane protein